MSPPAKRAESEKTAAERIAKEVARLLPCLCVVKAGITVIRSHDDDVMKWHPPSCLVHQREMITVAIFDTERREAQRIADWCRTKRDGLHIAHYEEATDPLWKSRRAVYDALKEVETFVLSTTISSDEATYE